MENYIYVQLMPQIASFRKSSNIINYCFSERFFFFMIKTKIKSLPIKSPFHSSKVLHSWSTIVWLWNWTTYSMQSQILNSIYVLEPCVCYCWGGFWSWKPGSRKLKVQEFRCTLRSLYLIHIFRSFIYTYMKSLRTSTDSFYNSTFRDYYLSCSLFFFDFMHHTLLWIGA